MSCGRLPLDLQNLALGVLCGAAGWSRAAGLVPLRESRGALERVGLDFGLCRGVDRRGGECGAAGAGRAGLACAGHVAGCPSVSGCLRKRELDFDYVR